MVPIATTNLGGDAAFQSEDKHEYGSGNVFGQRTSPTNMAHARRSKNDARTQETFNRQLTVPPTSHRRPVFNNQTHRQFINNPGVTWSFDSCHHPDTHRGRFNAVPQTIQYPRNFFHRTLKSTLSSCQMRQSYTLELKHDHDASKSNPNNCLKSTLTKSFPHLSSRGKCKVRPKGPVQPCCIPLAGCRAHTQDTVPH